MYIVCINLKIDVADKADTAYTGLMLPAGLEFHQKFYLTKCEKGAGRTTHHSPASPVHFITDGNISF